MKQYTYKKRAMIHGLGMAVFLGACLAVQADDQDKGISAQTTVNTSADSSKTDRSTSDRSATDANANRADNGKLSHSDASFVREAAQGGLMEVKMGQMAKDHASSADVKNYGERLVKDHAKANDKLTQLAGEKGVNLAKDIEPKHTGMLKDWEQKSGTDFDKAFIQHALKDHKKDIGKFEKASRDLKDTELRSFAMETLPTLREHYDEAQRIARSLGIDTTTADTSDYHRNDATSGLGASPAAGSPGVSVETQGSSVNRIDSNLDHAATGRIDTDVDRTRNSGGASTSVDVNTAPKSRDNQSSSYNNSYNNSSSGNASVSTSGSATSSSSDTSATASTGSNSGQHKFLGITTQKGDGKTLGLNTRKDDGKYLGFIPAPGHKKAENRVDVDMNNGNASASVGTAGSAQTGAAADTDVSVKHDKDSKASTVSYSELPQAVQDAIKSNGGSSDVKSIKKHTENGKTVYNVSFRKEGKDTKMKIAEDGTVLKDNNK